MGDLVITILIFVGVIGVTAALFGGWLVVSIIRFAARAMSGQRQQPGMIRQMGTPMGGGPMCPNDRCRTPNPPAAQFCRRCGQALGPAQRVGVRRAAMW